ncbi:hypothetical protein [Streptomyces noursei]|uniref:Uncharacterized protein n=1 Tax=Streptomyces noursei TaxID=1971 RepID=A0A2N8PAY5_STRNR|nr:hypothetical protein [Streptomyces noursei]PNE38152.1 hypothetical protein AOB60_29020 [Streptomyces noursei]
MDSCGARRPAYRCRHGHSNSTPPASNRPPNGYVREDHILPHLPALPIRLTSTNSDRKLPKPGHEEPFTKADTLKRLRANDTTLTCHPAARPLTTLSPPREEK